MSKLLQPEWEKFRDGTIADAPAEFVREAQFFFFAGANVMYALFMKAPEADVDHLVYMNELQHELLEFIRHGRNDENHTASSPADPG